MSEHGVDHYQDFLQLFDSQSEGFGINQERFVLDVRDLVLPVHIKWNFLGVVSFLLSHPMDAHTEQVLDRLLADRKKVNNETGNVPALTALAFQASNKDFFAVVLRITRKLLDSGADPLFISRKTCR